MVELGNLNLFIEPRNEFISSDIINFLDLTGVNQLYIMDENYGKKLLKCKYLIIRTNEIETKLKENLFRIEHIFIETQQNRVSTLYEKIRKITTIPITFIVSNGDILNINEFDNSYELSREIGTSVTFTLQSMRIKKNYIIKDLKNNWTSNIHDLKKSWIRNKKLEDLFGEE